MYPSVKKFLSNRTETVASIFNLVEPHRWDELSEIINGSYHKAPHRYLIHTVSLPPWSRVDHCWAWTFMKLSDGTFIVGFEYRQDYHKAIWRFSGLVINTYTTYDEIGYPRGFGLLQLFFGWLYK